MRIIRPRSVEGKVNEAVAVGGQQGSLARRPGPPTARARLLGEACLPPPGSLVRPAFKNSGSEDAQPALYPSVRFPGGVIAAAMQPFCSSDSALAALRDAAPSRNASAIACGSGSGNNVTDFDAAVNGWSFRPVDDLGCEPGVLYGIFWSFRIVKDGATSVRLESRSDNALAGTSTLLMLNGGTRHHSANSTPDTLVWGNPSRASDFPALGYYGMKPVGGVDYFGDWPLQGGSPPLAAGGVAFEQGERITVRPMMQGGGANALFYLDHLVFMPSIPLGVTDPTALGNQSKNFRSSALTAFGYEESPNPVSVTNPVDDGQWFVGDTVDDTQQLDHALASAMHFTVASHDESDATGLFTGVGGVHVYVLCRLHMTSGTYTGISRSGGHVSCFTASHPLADILCDEPGNWVWGYAGRMPLGDGPQGAFGIIQWRNTTKIFWSLTAPDSVRTSFIAYLPQAPCLA